MWETQRRCQKKPRKRNHYRNYSCIKSNSFSIMRQSASMWDVLPKRTMLFFWLIKKNDSIKVLFLKKIFYAMWVSISICFTMVLFDDKLFRTDSLLLFFENTTFILLSEGDFMSVFFESSYKENPGKIIRGLCQTAMLKSLLTIRTCVHQIFLS